jgi:predicted AlkP superfamily phosphohydrolase/phosphomutase
VKFEMLPHLASTSGICRFYMKQVHPRFKLYVSPINIDPSDPVLPISTPDGYAERLARELGPFHTQGIAQDTKALSAGVFDEKDYYDQAMFVLDERLRAYDHLLSHFTGGLLFFYFSSIDLNSHMYWRTMDPRHPLYTAALGRQYGRTVEDLYAKMDAALAKAMKYVDANTTLLVLSDHGFNPFYRTFSQNAWLLENGYAALRDPALRGQTKLFANTNWDKTYAYGLGINGLYLNLRGRDKHGVVSRGRQADMLLDEIVAKLAAEKDPETNQAVFAGVYKAKDVYRGPCAKDAPDIILGFNRGYRASWKTILGTYERKVVADNQDKWSGDHCMDPSGLSGVLLANRKITSETPALIDLAPTILAEYGLAAPAGTQGKVILEKA